MDRRKKKDLWAGLLFGLNLFSWLVLFVLLFVFHRAQPEFESFFDRFYQLSLRTEWDVKFIFYLICMSSMSIIISIGGLILGIFRGRRKEDHKRALILTGIISCVLLSIAVFII